MKFQVVIFAKKLKLNSKSATLYFKNRYITLEISYIIHIFPNSAAPFVLKICVNEIYSIHEPEVLCIAKGEGA